VLGIFMDYIPTVVEFFCQDNVCLFGPLVRTIPSVHSLLV
jgi:hypothetical protein